MKITQKNLTGTFAMIILLMANTNKSFAHCEIPCGIYGDSMRVELIKEHIITIEKSMKEIKKLSKEGDKNYNQLVRWIVNKEEHAKKIQDIVSQYFMHQRIKIALPGDDNYEKYITQLTLLHKMQIYAMKSKQTTDLKYIEMMRETIKKFAHSYFNEHTHEHRKH